MSTSVEFRSPLPEIHLRPIIDIPTRQSDEDECRTPTSSEYKIPLIETCPPAPRKRRKLMLCKRKLWSEMQFFETDGQDKIDSFFRCSYNLSQNIKKRSCPNT
ncbi:hypothetical protein AQUCO_01900151v1 [Aquilegia coerulea]|uniref:Uncharacterized protein n=1 Tax=Aquilegia coerulea TaxID=218851 RepID=A0A2G5DJW5_AQUCA|nr:hypothetical protein AQUCO_01900151v1 [Aquilegia coerulea]